MLSVKVATTNYYLSHDYYFSLLRYNRAQIQTTKIVPTTCLVKQVSCFLLFVTYKMLRLQHIAAQVLRIRNLSRQVS